jgi:hypothetical protein
LPAASSFSFVRFGLLSGEATRAERQTGSAGNLNCEPPFCLEFTIATCSDWSRLWLLRLPRRATRHKLGIQKYKGPAGPQVATLFE